MNLDKLREHLTAIAQGNPKAIKATAQFLQKADDPRGEKFFQRFALKPGQLLPVEERGVILSSFWREMGDPFWLGNEFLGWATKGRPIIQHNGNDQPIYLTNWAGHLIPIPPGRNLTVYCRADKQPELEA